MRVLVAEDDPGLRSVLERGLREQGYVVDAVADGDTAVAHLRAYEYAVAVLDWRMPGRSGIEVIAAARARGIATPVLLLTARDAPADRVTGLDAGADDYLVKPFDFAELLARLRALQRRPPEVLAERLVCGQLEYDPAGHRLVVAGREVPLTATELGIAELLTRRSPSVVDRRTIAVQVWDDESDAVGSNTIDVHVARLRSKLNAAADAAEAAGAPEADAAPRARIETVRGIGYRLVAG